MKSLRNKFRGVGWAEVFSEESYRVEKGLDNRIFQVFGSGHFLFEPSYNHVPRSVKEAIWNL